MNELAKRIGASPLPAVNLIPKDIAEKRALRAVQVTALFAVLIAIGVVAVAWFLAWGARGLAQDNVDDAVAAEAEAIAERDAKVVVYEAYREREEQEFGLAQVGYGEIAYSALSSSILATADEDTSFDSVAFFGPSAQGLGNVIVDPVVGGGVGTVEFISRALSLEDANAHLERIEALPGIANVSATTEAYGTDGADVFWLVTGRAVLTEGVLTGRLVPEDSVTGISVGEVIVAVDPGVAPSPEPSAEPSPSAAAEETTEEEG
ncbi:hypothetical protein [Demequina activiva]|uniref:Uncharacterized protein n=1 Tax=Demequina activiva TaxID=1582364 RepID=A0A919Q6B3_9MICO|nr:hypothetical protein [Demequina activiva]GIG54620.1 hypothetical protein Dac01nite_13720 [Demequina activiva]